MKNRLLLWSITASLAGFLFGFDTIVVSGAEEDFQRHWQLDGFWHGLCMSAALWGTVVGSIFGGILAARFGRRKCLIVAGVLYLVSAVASGIAADPWTFMIARFIGGLGVRENLDGDFKRLKWDQTKHLDTNPKKRKKNNRGNRK